MAAIGDVARIAAAAIVRITLPQPRWRIHGVQAALTGEGEDGCPVDLLQQQRESGERARCR